MTFSSHSFNFAHGNTGCYVVMVYGSTLLKVIIPTANYLWGSYLIMPTVSWTYNMHTTIHISSP